MQNNTKSLNKCLRSDTQSINIYTSKENTEIGIIEMNYSEFKEYAQSNAEIATAKLMGKFENIDNSSSKEIVEGAKDLVSRIENMRITEKQYNENKDQCIWVMGVARLEQKIIDESSKRLSDKILNKRK